MFIIPLINFHVKKKEAVAVRIYHPAVQLLSLIYIMNIVGR